MQQIGQRERMFLFLNYGATHNVRAFNALLTHFPDPEEAYLAAARRNAAAFDFSTNFIQSRLFEAARDGFLDRYVDWLNRNEIGVSIPEHSDYPVLLRGIHDPPSVLFYRGRLVPEPQLPIAVVGARRCTKYGADIAKLFSFELVKCGATIISGMAAGADTAAARGALDCPEADYPTVAVLGTGIDVIYPKGNERLFADICERGAVMTEFLPKSGPLPEHFPVRNRIISGLSRGVLITEAAERSGASITANCALEQGRDVYAVPGRITDLLSVGTNRLIQQGAAKPVFCTADILCEYGMADEEKKSVQPTFAADVASLSVTEKRIADALRSGEKDVDELAEALGLSAADLNSSLTAMEFSGIIKPLPGRRYALELQQ